jgi:hypothetical protein
VERLTRHLGYDHVPCDPRVLALVHSLLLRLSHMIDLHAHILRGLDDGPATLEDAIAILRAAAGDGTELIAATPHVRDDYPTTPQAMEAALAEALVSSLGRARKHRQGVRLPRPPRNRRRDPGRSSS